MQSTPSKLYVLILLLPTVFWTAPKLQAQTSTAPMQVVGPSPTDFELRADGTMIAKGATGTGSLLSTDQGAGTRLLWYPNLGAFRAGTVTGSAWDLSNLGQYSLALGCNTTASGNAATALGNSSIASGSYAFSGGYASTASGQYSFAFGDFAFASGLYSTALGCETYATGTGSLALGYYTSASANYATAVGIFNAGGGSSSNTAATDPIFEVGNGVGYGPRAHGDALVVYRNGSAAFQGTVTVAAGGDIPMYTGN